jgi:HlyD family secretion protein
MKKRWFYLSAAVVVAGLFAAWEMWRPDAAVEVIRPRVQTIRAYVEEQAVTELPRDYLISMPISGWLEPIDLREGDTVAAGQVLARLDRDDLADRVHQAEQRIAVLQTNIAEVQDNRLEENVLVETKATVKAIDETVSAAEAKLEATRAIREFAESELARYKEITEAGHAAERELRQAETEARRARAEFQSDALELAALKTLAAVSYIGPKFINDYIDRKKFKKQSYDKQLREAIAELEIQKRNLSRTEVKSPIDGVVLKRHQTRRQFLSAGTPLLTLGRLDDMEVIAEVLTERATRLSPGDPVDVFGEAITDGPVHGQVWRVYPAGFKKISSLGVEQQRVKVAIKLDHRPERLGVHFRVHVRIYYHQADEALTLPRTALFRGDEGQWQVMAVEDGVTRLRTIEVGIMNDQDAQVLSGLNPQTLIVSRPSRDITEGLRVDINAQD